MVEDLKTPKISVIMPVHNGEKQLKESVDSILNQTYKDFELIIINDASLDSTEEIIHSYKKDERIVYVKNDSNLGLIKTLNKGLGIAKGEFIARMDHDDIAHHERLGKQLKIFENNPDLGVCGTWFTCFGDHIEQKIIKHPEENEVIKISLLGYCCLGHPTVMMRKTAILNEKYDEDYYSAEDYEFWTRLSKITNFYNIQESLLLYRLHDSNVSVLHKDRQSENTKKIISNQLRNLGIPYHEMNIINCQTLFGVFFKSRYTDEEFRKLIIFANSIQYHNQQKKLYDEQELHKMINKRLLEVFNQTLNKKLSTVPFLLKYRKEIIFQRSIFDNTKMLAKIILKK